MVEVVARAVVILAVGAVALMALSALSLAYATHPVRYVSRATPADLGWPFERVSLQTEDGLTLSAWHIPALINTPGHPTVIVLHGYPYDKGNVLGVTQFLHRDFDLLLFDFRYFGESEGSFTSVGYHERLDLVAALDYARSRGARSIGVWGFSMGAAVALLAVPEAEGVDAIVADSAYAHLDGMVMDYYRGFPLADRALALCTGILSRVFLGIWPSDVSPLRAAAGAQLPILVIHGAEDRTIPRDHFEDMRAALAGNPAARFWLVEGSSHGLTYATASKAYERIVLEFFRAHLG